MKPKLRKVEKFKELKEGMPVYLLGPCGWCGNKHEFRRILLNKCKSEKIYCSPQDSSVPTPFGYGFSHYPERPCKNPNNRILITALSVEEGVVYTEDLEDGKDEYSDINKKTKKPAKA